MKILVFSDSHRDISLMSRILERVGDDIQTVFHLGDCIDDVKQLETQFPDRHFFAVRGNCDYNAGTHDELETVVSIMGRRILLVHGHKYDVKYSLLRIKYMAEEKQVDACLFGHTHQPALFTEGSIFFMNPGSISQPRGGTCSSYGILDISTYGVIDGRIVEKNGIFFKPADA